MKKFVLLFVMTLFIGCNTMNKRLNSYVVLPLNVVVEQDGLKRFDSSDTADNGQAYIYKKNVFVLYENDNIVQKWIFKNDTSENVFNQLRIYRRLYDTYKVIDPQKAKEYKKKIDELEIERKKQFKTSNTR